MALVAVYPFEIYDISIHGRRLHARMGTLEAIRKIDKQCDARPLLNDGIEIDDALLEEGFTALRPAALLSGLA